LEEELGRCREASTMVEGLEKENKRLVWELAQKLKLPQQQQDIGTPRPQVQAGTGPKSTPNPTNPLSSGARMEIDESNAIATKERYQSLVTKYNILSDKYLELKDARQVLENALRVKVDRIKLWDAWKKDQDEATSKKNDKIQRLQEEIQRLRAQVNGGRGLSLALVSRLDAVDADETGEEVARVVQVSKSSPLKDPQGGTATDQCGTTGTPPEAAESSAHEVALNAEEPDLPAHRAAARTRINDTQFEEVEIHHTSSTEDSGLLSSSKVAGDEQAAEKPTSARSSSPVVEFVSARSVKKRKTPHDSQSHRIKTKVKVETLSSSPIGLVRLQYLNPSESLDLDDIGEKIDTPKKQRRLIELNSQDFTSVSVSPLAVKPQSQTNSQNQGHRNDMEVEEPRNTSQETPVRRRDSILQPRSTNRQILPRTSENRASKRRRIASDVAVGELVEDGEIEAAAIKPRRQAMNTSDRLNGLLAKPTPPKQALSPRLAGARDQKRPARTPVTAGHAHQLQRSREAERVTPMGMLAKCFPQSYRDPGRESAETSRPSSQRSSNSGSAEPILPSSRTSLRESAERSRPTSKDTSKASAEPLGQLSRRLVADYSKSNENTILPPKRLPITSAYFAKATPRTPAEISKPASRDSAKLNNTASDRSGRSGWEIGESDWEMDPDQEPLRARPISRLNLSDFKVNPNYNQGYGYAFQETVRGRDARQKCLQGCTKPECCGRKFRVLAEMDREARGPPTLSQEEADELLLEEYLGDNAYKIQNMSTAQKEEIILQARTRELANKLGRHRHAYERRTTPPGFWRPDFPTTQEEREDREKANKIARSHVEERYKEAMRPNGRFLFRDE
jgi:hypothetical protein